LGVTKLNDPLVWLALAKLTLLVENCPQGPE
jgi:hypothetical protein